MISNGPPAGLLRIERGVHVVLRIENPRRRFAGIVERA
jgi:hypothetical protein